MPAVSENIQKCDILFIGEKPTQQDINFGRPLTGTAGSEFDRMLVEAGLQRSRCAITNVAQEDYFEDNYYKTKEAKLRELTPVMGKYPNKYIREGLADMWSVVRKTKPNVVCALGEVALWALTGNSGITKWRGSTIQCEIDIGDEMHTFKVIPTFAPAAVLNTWSWRNVAVQDLRRVENESETNLINKPNWKRITNPTFDEAIELIESVRGKTVTSDIETRGGQISCIGFATSKDEAFCIPFMSVHKEGWSFWNTTEEEVVVILALRSVMTDPTTKIVGQNWLYDSQYIAKIWGFYPNCTDDTMIMQHVAYPGMKKSLDFIASMYCDYYCYWKDDGKEWDPKKHPEEQHWEYNCDDCLYTYEAWETLCMVLDRYRLREPYKRQMRLFRPVLKMMLRGVNIDKKFKNRLDGVLNVQISQTNAWLEEVLGHPLNTDNPEQVKRLLYGDLKQQRIVDKKTKQPTANDDALNLIKTRQPLLRPLCEKIQEGRSLRVFRSSFALAPLSSDGRLRTSFNITGTDTYRFSSSKDSFGQGANLQTIPKGQDVYSLISSWIEGIDAIQLNKDEKEVTSPFGTLKIDEDYPQKTTDVVRTWVARLSD